MCVWFFKISGMDVLEVLLGDEELLTIEEDVMDKTEHTGPGATKGDHVCR